MSKLNLASSTTSFPTLLRFPNEMDLTPTIKAVQAKLGLTTDGIAGPLTWAAISKALGVDEQPPGRPLTSDEIDTAWSVPVDPRSESNIDSLMPVVRPLARQLIHEANAVLAPKVVKVTSGYRTFSEQKELYDKYKTGGPQAAPPGYSNHNYALAFDVTLFDENDKPIWESALYKTIGKIGRTVGLIWGGDWHSVDEPHFEFRPEWAADLSEDEALQAYRDRRNKGVAIV
jgi:peptidoglycan L-alanyl-D-glutamate endopeptidase CwlK